MALARELGSHLLDQPGREARVSRERSCVCATDEASGIPPTGLQCHGAPSLQGVMWLFPFHRGWGLHALPAGVA